MDARTWFKAPADDDEDWDAAIARAKMQALSPMALIPPPIPRQASATAPYGPLSSLSRQAQVARGGPPKAPSPPLPPELQETPPPAPKAPRAWAPDKMQATLDALVRGGPRKPEVTRPFATRPPAVEDMPTPPPLGTGRSATRPLSGLAKRPL
jgi:hypothetical protein